MSGSGVFSFSRINMMADLSASECLNCAKGAQRDALFAETAVQLTALRRYQPTPSKHLTAIEKVLSAERVRKGEPPLQFSPTPQHQFVNGGGPAHY